MKQHRSRKFFITSFKKLEEYERKLKDLNYDYLVIARELAPTTENKHIHAYIRLKNALTWGSMKNKFEKANIEIAKGNDEQGYEYCKKQGNFEEFGTRSKQGARKDIEKVKEMITEGSTMKEIFDQASNLQTLRIAEVGFKYMEKPRNWKPIVKWYYGKPGTGKTLTASTEMPNAYWCMTGTKWWEGYDAHEDVIIDELRPESYKLEYLLQLIDCYPMRIETKGASRQFLAKRIIITTCYKPKTWCEINNSDENYEQLTRRLTLIKKFKHNTEVQKTFDTIVAGNTSAATDEFEKIFNEEINFDIQKWHSEEEDSEEEDSKEEHIEEEQKKDSLEDS